ncbi:MAG: aminoacetone oxidase family FAD-binding enzyme [Eubacteriales bacterium]|nr:aminoacetone oxidase family FAD-binding enzyme [Eubacteriales bacterium]
MNGSYDLAIVGGGAAGLTAAVTAARLGLRTIVLERGNRVLRKVLVTGSGRCNVTNARLSRENYHGAFADAGWAIVSRFDTEAFFSELGLVLKTEESGRVYPLSDTASSVVDVLRFAAEDRGVTILTDTTVTRVEGRDGAFVLNGIPARKVILAVGGKAGGARFGTDGTSYVLAGDGEPAVFRSLVQLKTDDPGLRSLSGLRRDVRLTRGGLTAEGEILFTDYGVSGPVVFALSRSEAHDDVSVDFRPERNWDEVYDALRERAGALAGRELSRFLAGMFHNRIALALYKKAGLIVAGRVCGSLSDGEAAALTSAIKDYRFAVSGKMPWENAQVTAGGLVTADPETLESTRRAGIYLTGEMLDIDGDCGGYNLQWAWASGERAARSVFRALRGGES